MATCAWRAHPTPATISPPRPCKAPSHSSGIRGPPTRTGTRGPSAIPMATSRTPSACPTRPTCEVPGPPRPSPAPPSGPLPELPSRPKARRGRFRKRRSTGSRPRLVVVTKRPRADTTPPSMMIPGATRSPTPLPAASTPPNRASRQGSAGWRMAFPRTTRREHPPSSRSRHITTVFSTGRLASCKVAREIRRPAPRPTPARPSSACLTSWRRGSAGWK